MRAILSCPDVLVHERAEPVSVAVFPPPPARPGREEERQARARRDKTLSASQSEETRL